MGLPADRVGKGWLLFAVLTVLFPSAAYWVRARFTRPLWLRSGKVSVRCPHFEFTLDSYICSIENSAMAALLELHPDCTHPVLSGLTEVHRLLDRMHAGVNEALVSGEHALVVAELDRATRRIEALKLKVVAAADQAEVAKDAGFTGADAWLAKTTTVSRSDAARQVALAGELNAGHEATAVALDAGLVSPEHAAVIVRATGQLPRGVSQQQRHTVEAKLVEKAARFSPDQLRRIARRSIETVEPDQTVVDAHENELIRTEEQAAREKCSLTLHDNGDGTTSGHFTIPALAAAMLSKVIDAMTAPRRMREGAADRSFDWRHRRGLAFAELLEHLPTDHLHNKTAATVVVTIDHAVLVGAMKAAHLDTDQILSAGEARRLACTAGILPAVLGTKSEALDLGRESRLFSEAQRIAKGLEHTTCAAAGCERPYAWCELHHRQPWARGGRTNLADAIPLCSQHHHCIHDSGFNHQSLPDGSVRFSRRT